MADTKISALPASTTPLAGTEVLPIVQSGATKQVSVANLTAGRALSAAELTLTTGNLIVASGQGIDFSATPGTGTSELLDDYEEGTWTGTLTGSTAAPTTPVTATGKYTKVGNLVTITIAFVNVDTTGATGNVRITGIPFTANSDDNLGTAGLQGFVAVAPIVDVFDSTIAFLESGTVNFIAMSAGAGKFVFINATYITP